MIEFSADPSRMVAVIQFLAVVAGAVYGVLLASRKGMDIVGVFAVASMVAFGGGTLRDLFLDRHPLFWIGKPHYLVTVFLISLAAGLITRHIRHIRPLLLVPDSFGMGLFTMAGAGIAMEAGVHPFIVVVLGTITGTFGSVIGEIVCNEIPTLFRPAPLCATCAFLGAWAWLGARAAGVPEPYTMILGASIIVVLRLAAVRWNWRFPAVRTPPVG